MLLKNKLFKRNTSNWWKSCLFWMNKKLPIIMLVYIYIWFFIPNTINHITRAGMLIDSRKKTMLFSFISDMMDWPSQNKTLQNKRGPPLKILSNSKSIIKTVNMQLLLLRDLTSVGKSYQHWWSILNITEGTGNCKIIAMPFILLW